MTESEIITYYDGLIESITEAGVKKYKWLDFDEAKQSVMIGCFYAIRSYTKEKKGSQWLGYLVLRCWGSLMDYVRELQPFPRRSKGLSYEPFKEVDEVDECYNFMDDLDNVIDLNTILEFVKQLSPREAEVVYSTYVRPVEVKELAKTLNVRPQYISQVREKAEMKLKKSIGVTS